MSALALVAAPACTGVIDGSAEPSSIRDTTVTVDGGVDEPSPVGTCEASAAVLEARLLTPRQYDHTISDLLGFESGAVASLSEGDGVAFALVKLDEVGVERFELAASGVAERAVQELARVFPCASTVTADDPCVQSFIADLGKRAYRRVLTATEQLELSALFRAGWSEGGAATGVSWLVSGVMQSPDFLYRLALNPADGSGAVRALSGHEISLAHAMGLEDLESFGKSELAASGPVPGLV